MLLSLAIRDIVLIETLDLDWQPTLCALTGETGAGKSILLDALGLAIGARGNARLVREGVSQGSVSAVFTCSPQHPVFDILREHGLLAACGESEADAVLILRRLQMRDGVSRAFCNDIAISVGLLRAIGDSLVEIHGQNETQSLTDPQVQLNLLDSYGGLGAQVEELKGFHAVRAQAAEALRAHQAMMVGAGKEIEFLRASCAALAALVPRAGEETVLAEERALLLNAEKIASDLDFANNFLEEDGQMRANLGAALTRLERVAVPQLAAATAALERALIECDEAASRLREARETIAAAPQRLARVEERLFALRSLARQHQVDVDDLHDLEARLNARLLELDNLDETQARLKAQLAAADAKWRQAGDLLSKARRAAAQELDAMVNVELAPLKLDGGRFYTQFTALDYDAAGASGLERIAFVASTNPGVSPAPIAKIASGGELARFMLALKVALAPQERHDAPAPARTLIFDEVDSGVGGAVARAVGVRLNRLAASGQILVVTHSPQVAASSQHQWRVEKKTDGSRTRTDVVYLDAGARVEEIARMLSGSAVSDEARAAAQKLLEAD